MELELGDTVKHKLTGKRYRVKEIEREGNDYNVICRRLNNENREWEKSHFSDAELEKVADEYREIEYRKREGCDSWHWCRNCSEWPTADFIQRYTKPNGNLCKRCEEKEKVNNCIKEQKILLEAREKIEYIQKDILHSQGFTKEEAKVASKVGLIDPDQAWWWVEEWQKGEREAEKDIKEGRVKKFANIEDLIKDLHS